MTPRIETELTDEEVQLINIRLDEFNARFTPPRDFNEIKLALRGDDGELVGGLIASIQWRWCHVSILWVSDALRGEGYGSQLLKAGEEVAIERGCQYAKLHTFDFQARPFYEAHGSDQPN